MKAAHYLRMPFWALGVLSSEKSFVRNPVLGDERLNRRGLHRWRVRAAAGLAARRRNRMRGHLTAEERAAFDRDGYFRIEQYLPEDLFRQLREDLLAAPFPAREMRQGETVTRMTPVTPALRRAVPAIAAVVDDRRINDRLDYAAGRAGAPVFFVQTVIADRKVSASDPQTMLHSDTFHSTAKAWLFLHDVGEEDGPFMYVPTSHRLTPERLAWEHEQSIAAKGDIRRAHAHGSFRLTDADLAALGLPPPRRMTVTANTLIVADTYGFHARAPSARPTMRIEVHGHLRRNPFVPWNGGDLRALPFVRDNQLPLFLAFADVMERYAGKRTIWRDVGAVRVDSEAHV